MHAELGSYEPRSLVLPLLSPCHARYLSHELIKNEPAEEEAADREGGNREASRGKKMVFVSANDHQEWLVVRSPPTKRTRRRGRERERKKDELYQDE